MQQGRPQNDSEQVRITHSQMLKEEHATPGRSLCSSLLALLSCELLLFLLLKGLQSSRDCSRLPVQARCTANCLTSTLRAACIFSAADAACTSAEGSACHSDLRS